MGSVNYSSLRLYNSPNQVFHPIIEKIKEQKYLITVNGQNRLINNIFRFGLLHLIVGIIPKEYQFIMTSVVNRR